MYSHIHTCCFIIPKNHFYTSRTIFQYIYVFKECTFTLLPYPPGVIKIITKILHTALILRNQFFERLPPLVFRMPSKSRLQVKCNKSDSVWVLNFIKGLTTVRFGIVLNDIIGIDDKLIKNKSYKFSSMKKNMFCCPGEKKG